VHASSVPFTSLQIVVPLSGYVACQRRAYQPPIRPGAALVLRPSDPVDLLWGEHCMGLVVWVDDKAIDSLMMRVFGYPLTPHVKFRHSIDLSSTPGSSIADALAVVMRECEQPQSLLNRGITTQAVEDLLLSSLIYAAVDDGQFDSSPSGPRVGSVHLRRALEFIHHHLRDDVTVSQLASVAGVSVRTLQYEFARRFGVGPITMIRREKLRQVRMTLLDPAQDSETIGDVAAKWGFFDAKYFAKMYLREFSERPSDTRRRHA
jgi:AraC-like DNA-binding protein